MAIVEMLFNTSLITLVGAGEQANLSPRTVRMFNTKNSKVSRLHYTTTLPLTNCQKGEDLPSTMPITDNAMLMYSTYVN
jgi:hypothetical protein